MLSIHYNHSAQLAINGLAKSQSALSQSIERLSSGKRINSAKDDPAGLAIANRMTANIRGLQQAARNANDAISVVQTAEGAISEINQLIHRIRELSVQALSETNQDKDLSFIQQEIDQYLEEIDRISTQTQFNGKYILADGVADMQIQVGAHDGQTITIQFSAMSLAGLGLEGFSIMAKDGTPATDKPLATLDNALNQVDTQRSHLGAMHNRFESVIRTNQNMVTNLSAARSRIEDVDYAVEVSNMVRAQIQQQIGVMVLAQANQTPQLILALLRDSLRT